MLRLMNAVKRMWWLGRGDASDPPPQQLLLLGRPGLWVEADRDSVNSLEHEQDWSWGSVPCPSCSPQGSGSWSHIPGIPKTCSLSPPTGIVTLPDNLFLSTQGRWSSVLLTYVWCAPARYNMLSGWGIPSRRPVPGPVTPGSPRCLGS